MTNKPMDETFAINERMRGRKPKASVTNGSGELAVGAVFRRRRGFRRPPENYPQNGWWSPNYEYPATDYGWEFREILEIVNTKTLGGIIIFSDWWVDPEGVEIDSTQDWITDRRVAKIRQERYLLQSITSKKMEMVEPRPDARMYDLGNMVPAGQA
jgi:hypothetical protein